MPKPFPATRKHLSADALIRTVKARFEQLADHRTDPIIALPDALLSAFALFSLKDVLVERPVPVGLRRAATGSKPQKPVWDRADPL